MLSVHNARPRYPPENGTPIGATPFCGMEFQAASRRRERAVPAARSALHSHMKIFTTLSLLLICACALVAVPKPPVTHDWSCETTISDDGDGNVTVTTDCTFTGDPIEDPQGPPVE